MDAFHESRGTVVGNNCLTSYSVLFGIQYSIVKDSSADLGVNSKIVQIRPTVKAVGTKISKKFFLHFCHYFDISEGKYRGIIFSILNI